MSKLVLQDVELGYTRPLVGDVNLRISNQEKVGVVGINGAGKSTLIKCIIGELEHSQGNVSTQRGLRIAHIDQHVPAALLGTSFQQCVAQALLAADWSGWDNSLKTTFASIEHHFDNDWTARALFTHQQIDFDAKLFSGSGYPDRVTGLGLFPVGLASKTATRQNSVDAMASGPFQLFGRQHELVVGFVGSKRISNQDSTGFVFGHAPMGSLYDWRGNYPELDFASAGYTPTHITTKQSGVYSAVRFSLADPLKLIVGGRLSDYELDQNTNGVRFH